MKGVISFTCARVARAGFLRESYVQRALVRKSCAIASLITVKVVSLHLYFLSSILATSEALRFFFLNAIFE